MKKLSALTLSLAVFCAAPVLADEYIEAVQGLYDAEIKSWLKSPLIVSAVNAQNEKHAGFSQAEIDALDQQWRAETGASAQPMIEAVLGSELSGYLKSVKEQGQGLYTEIFVMDARGLNVAQSDVTSDYWQGDEDKWLETFDTGVDAIHIGEIEEDESTQMFQSQFSITVVDPATGSAIGAVTIGINVGDLLQ